MLINRTSVQKHYPKKTFPTFIFYEACFSLLRNVSWAPVGVGLDGYTPQLAKKRAISREDIQCQKGITFFFLEQQCKKTNKNANLELWIKKLIEYECDYIS